MGNIEEEREHTEKHTFNILKCDCCGKEIYSGKLGCGISKFELDKWYYITTEFKKFNKSAIMKVYCSLKCLKTLKGVK